MILLLMVHRRRISWRWTYLLGDGNVLSRVVLARLLRLLFLVFAGHFELWLSCVPVVVDGVPGLNFACVLSALARFDSCLPTRGGDTFIRWSRLLPHYRIAAGRQTLELSQAAHNTTLKHDSNTYHPHHLPTMSIQPLITFKAGQCELTVHAASPLHPACDRH